MAEIDSWNRRWTYCWNCLTITPHEPHLQNWGKASPKCMICNNANVFADYDNIQTTERRYINTKQATIRSESHLAENKNSLQRQNGLW